MIENSFKFNLEAVQVLGLMCYTLLLCCGPFVASVLYNGHFKVNDKFAQTCLFPLFQVNGVMDNIDSPKQVNLEYMGV